MRTRSYLVLLSLATVAMLLVAACTSEGASTPTEEATAVPTVAPTEAGDPAGHEDGQEDAHAGEDDGHAHEPGEDHDTLAGAEEVVLRAEDIRYAPAKLEVAAGQPVNLRLVNDGSLEHDLVIDDTDFHLHAMPGEEVVGGLQIDEPGEYDFHCSVLGHKEAGMVGTLVVAGSDGHAHTHDAADTEAEPQQTSGTADSSITYDVTLDPVGHWHVLGSKTLKFTVKSAETGDAIDADNVTVLIGRAGSSRISERSLADGDVIAEGDGVYTLEYTASNFAPHAFSVKVENGDEVFTSAPWVVELSKAGQEGIRLDANGTSYVYQIRYYWDPGHVHASDTEAASLVFEIMRGVQEGDEINWDQPWRNTFNHVIDAEHPEVIITSEDGSVTEEIHPTYDGKGIYVAERAFSTDEVGHDGAEYVVTFKFTDPHNGGVIQNTEEFHLHVSSPH